MTSQKLWTKNVLPVMLRSVSIFIRDLSLLGKKNRIKYNRMDNCFIERLVTLLKKLDYLISMTIKARNYFKSNKSLQTLKLNFSLSSHKFFILLWMGKKEKNLRKSCKNNFFSNKKKNFIFNRICKLNYLNFKIFFFFYLATDY